MVKKTYLLLFLAATYWISPVWSTEVLVPELRVDSVSSDQVCYKLAKIQTEITGNEFLFSLNGKIGNCWIPKSIEEMANARSKSLDFSPFFQTKLFLSPRVISDFLQAAYLGGGEPFTVTTIDGIEIDGLFFDRASNDLVIVGNGFGNELEKSSPWVHIFSDKDVVLFNFRGHGLNKPSVLPQELFGEKDIDYRKIVRLNLEKTSFGKKEDLDVIAIASSFKSRKNYSQVFGVGQCFSCFVFAKVQADCGCFSKLIFDSCLDSRENLLKRIEENPQRFFDPQRAEWTSLTKSDASSQTQKNLELYLREKILPALRSQGPLKDSTSQYLAKIKNIPILFLHGKQDLMTPIADDFESNWTSVNPTCPKFAIKFDGGRHLTLGIKFKGICSTASNLFLDLPPDDFSPTVMNEGKLKDCLITRFSSDVGQPKSDTKTN